MGEEEREPTKSADCLPGQEREASSEKDVVVEESGGDGPKRARERERRCICVVWRETSGSSKEGSVSCGMIAHRGRTTVVWWCSRMVRRLVVSSLFVGEVWLSEF